MHPQTKCAATVCWGPDGWFGIQVNRKHFVSAEKNCLAKLQVAVFAALNRSLPWFSYSNHDSDDHIYDHLCLPNLSSFCWCFPRNCRAAWPYWGTNFRGELLRQ